VIAAVALFGATLVAAPSAADAGVPIADAAREVDAEAGAVDGGKAGVRADAPPGDARTSRAPSDAPPPPPLGRVSGRVFEKGSRTPIGGASLTADASAAGETDREGSFTADIPCGRRRLGVAAPGFEPLLTDVDACGPDSTGLVLRLVPAASAQFRDGGALGFSAREDPGRS
jgi:hypothetical protein